MTTTQAPAAHSHTVQLHSGAFADVDANGLVTLIWREEDMDTEPGCECEQDWRCHLHKGLPTWLETRYSELDLCPEEHSDFMGR